MPQTPGVPTEYGDYIESSGGLNNMHIYWIEVPPGTSQLVIQVFDADVGNSTTEDDAGRDKALTGDFTNSSCNYRVYNPSNTQVGLTVGLAQTNTSQQLSAATANNSWQTIHRNASGVVAINSPAAGHWRLEVDNQGGTAEENVNAIGVRAHDGTSGAGGVELNVYSDAFAMYGVNDNGATGIDTRVYTEYPYVTAGCNCYARNFDMDSVGTITYTAPTGYSANNTITANNAWGTTQLSGFSDFGQVPGSTSRGYGIWTRTTTMTTYGTGGNTPNYSPLYLGRYNHTLTGTQAPTTQPPTNVFRTYLPTDVGGAPVKPHMRQNLDWQEGPNPTQVNQQSIFRIYVDVVNPTPFAITFSGTNLVSAYIPGGQVLYDGRASATQGTIISQPSIGGSGAITWNPGVVAAGVTARMQYRVRITPTSAAAVNMTGTPTSNGTQGTFVDETGNTTQARATYTVGPLCQLTLTANSSPLWVQLDFFEAVVMGDERTVEVRWQTVSEINHAGFNVYRAVETNPGEFTKGERLNDSLITGEGSDQQGASYSIVDWKPLEAGTHDAYLLEDIDLGSHATLHGPAIVRSPLPRTVETGVQDWTLY